MFLKQETIHQQTATETANSRAYFKYSESANATPVFTPSFFTRDGQIKKWWLILLYENLDVTKQIFIFTMIAQQKKMWAAELLFFCYVLIPPFQIISFCAQTTSQ